MFKLILPVLVESKVNHRFSIQNLGKTRMGNAVVIAFDSTAVKTVADIIRQRPKEFEVKRYCVELLEKCGSMEYTRKKLVELETKSDFVDF